VAAASDTAVLDALVEIQRAQDPTLAFRYACRVGMCGSCAMVVNGRERRACRTRLESRGPGPVSVRPLYHFPLLGDLVVDMTLFAARLQDVGAALTPGENAEPYARVSGLSAERNVRLGEHDGRSQRAISRSGRAEPGADARAGPP